MSRWVRRCRSRRGIRTRRAPSSPRSGTPTSRCTAGNSAGGRHNPWTSAFSNPANQEGGGAGAARAVGNPQGDGGVRPRSRTGTTTPAGHPGSHRTGERRAQGDGDGPVQRRDRAAAEGKPCDRRSVLRPARLRIPRCHVPSPSEPSVQRAEIGHARSRSPNARGWPPAYRHKADHRDGGSDLSLTLPSFSGPCSARRWPSRGRGLGAGQPRRHARTRALGRRAADPGRPARDGGRGRMAVRGPPAPVISRWRRIRDSNS
jgi:hypothetical protein